MKKIIIPKSCAIWLVMAFTLYPVVELTRMIWIAGHIYFPDRWVWELKLEIAFIWLCYLSNIPLLIKVLKDGDK